MDGILLLSALEIDGGVDGGKLLKKKQSKGGEHNRHFDPELFQLTAYTWY